MKTILSCTDFSSVTEKILDYSAQLGKAFGYKIYIVHIAAPDPDFVGYKPGPQVIREIRAEELTEEHKKLLAMKDNLTAQGLDAEALMVQGRTVEEIVNLSKKFDSEVIVIGSRHHGVLHKAFRGSVLDSVISESEIPLLVIPQEKKEAE